MNIFSFSSLFSKKQKNLSVPDTILIKKLKSLSSQSNLIVFKDAVIYHHALSYNIKLLVFDPLRGLYIFETKDWTYNELKDANIQKAQQQDSSPETLAFDNAHSIIEQKFNELTHHKSVPIFNYLLMENLNANEYEHLNDSFKELLPQEKVIFADSDESDIFKKLQNAADIDTMLPSSDKVFGTLFIQYSILQDSGTTLLSNTEQINFIDRQLPQESLLCGVYGSGKSSVILLKAIHELLKDRTQKIVIIKLTNLACDIFKKQLLDIIEHAIVTIDLNSIDVITPLELINRHSKKLKLEIKNHLDITPAHMKKNFAIADTLLCDDSDLMQEEFLLYLKHIQKKAILLFVKQASNNSTLNLSQMYRNSDKTISFYETNPHAKALHLINKYIKEEQKIIIVSNSQSREKLIDDLASFIRQSPQKIDSTLHLNQQDITNLLLCTYEDINALEANRIILLDLCFTSQNEIKYAFNLSDTSVDVLYEEDCQEIQTLRNKYEQSSKEHK